MRHVSDAGQLGAGQVAANIFCPNRLDGPFGGGLQIGGIATLVDEGLASVQFHDAVGDPVQHMAIVGHQQQGAPVAGQTALQPLDTVHIEMVGGLVQDEQIGGG